MKYQRISTQKLNKIFLCFSEDITATAAARIAGVNRNTANSYYSRIRKLVFEESLMPIIQGLTLADSTIYTDGWKTYDRLIFNGYKRYRVSLETLLRMPPRERTQICGFCKGKLGKQPQVAAQEPRQRH